MPVYSASLLLNRLLFLEELIKAFGIIIRSPTLPFMSSFQFAQPESLLMEWALTSVFY